MKDSKPKDKTQGRVMNAKCCKCGKQAVAYWPVVDPDIPAYPYCRECLDKAKHELMLRLAEIDKEYKNNKKYENNQV
jgi:hypothetical protein